MYTWESFYKALYRMSYKTNIENSIQFPMTFNYIIIKLYLENQYAQYLWRPGKEFREIVQDFQLFNGTIVRGL
jgi:hypothetical protein